MTHLLSGRRGACVFCRAAHIIRRLTRTQCAGSSGCRLFISLPLLFFHRRRSPPHSNPRRLAARPPAMGRQTSRFPGRMSLSLSVCVSVCCCMGRNDNCDASFCKRNIHLNWPFLHPEMRRHHVWRDVSGREGRGKTRAVTSLEENAKSI